MPIAGPTAVVMVSRGLESRWRAGIYIAAGSALAESVYVFMAFWGLTSVLREFPTLIPATRIVGSVILVALGIHFILKKSKANQEAKKKSPEQAGIKNFFFGLSLTALNPSLLVTWTAAVGVAHSTGLLTVKTSGAIPFALGAALGIVLWFAVLLWLLAKFGKKISGATLDRVIRWMGGLLVAVGIALFVRAILKWGSPN
jgi:threonine/homoserine/homoserine lactone efflux protein